MLQQWLVLTLLAAAPQQSDCPGIAHVPGGDVAHIPEADLDPNADFALDAATAELVADPQPRIERRVGDKGVKIDIDVPEGLVERPEQQCKE